MSFPFPFPFFLLLLLPLLISFVTSSSAVNPEVRALLSIKSALQDPLSALSSWDPTLSSSSPCGWRGVTCTSGHVTSLHLPSLQLSGPISPLISSLPRLTTLSLHSNSLNGTLPPSLSSLASLSSLFLHSNSLRGPLPASLSNLSSLAVLDLSRNSLHGPLPDSLPPSLRFLDLSDNSLSASLSQIRWTSAFRLQVLNLSGNNFTQQIPASFSLLQELKYLYLDHNHLSGPIPAALSNCTQLVHFSADGNSLAGVLPAGIPALPDIQVISLSNNRLSGNVPTTVFCKVGSNSSLRVVDLGFNGFHRLGDSGTTACLTNLRVLVLPGNQINGGFPTWLGNLKTLVTLDLSNNLLSGLIPSDVGKLVNLEELRLANNSFTGNVPPQIRNLTSLHVLDLGGNHFSGGLPDFLGDMTGLKTLSFNSNHFSGLVPPSLSGLSGLQTLDLSDNSLNGSIPLELTRLTNLTTLSLGGNRFSGEIPTAIGDLNQLSILNLSGNGLSGNFPGSLGNLYRLTTLDLSKQDLTGELPSEISGLPNLQVVALQENKLSGDVPEGFSSLLGLTYVNLSSNNFSGRIPSTLGYLDNLVVLSLSHNHISGFIPPEIGNCSSLQVLELGSNSLTGGIPSDVSHLVGLSRLDFGGNGLSGPIPGELSNCSALNSLIVKRNKLSGIIPASLSNLANLRTLDLSENDLSGVIPDNLTAIGTLTYFNVSGNDLQGDIPSALGSRFSDPSLYAGNQYLCGKPLNKSCPLDKTGRRRLTWLLVIVLGGTCLLAFCCCFYVFSLVRWRKTLRESGGTKEKKRSPSRPSSGTTSTGRGSSDSGGPKLVMFNNKITLAETIEATRNFDEETVLNRTKYGLLFKASYNDGMVLSIRRLPDGSLNETMFKKEAEALGKVKHRNLTVLRGYYAGPPDLRLLVYDYMPNGNLATLLQEASHQDGHVLNWPMRHLIALGIARGLAFLHMSQFVHGDVKPQNVLFDADFEAHLSDFGLDKLMVATPAAEPSTSSTLVGTLGYVSPEGGGTGAVTKESDVYSFGIVLLELLTGKKPVMFTQDEDIVKWVKRQLQRGQVTELLEPGLLELDPESSEWEEFLLGIKVGLLCTAPDPLDRPNMSDIVFMLEGCRVGPDIPSSADPTSHHSPV